MSKPLKIVICIPARDGSTRFPGKPLAKIAGKSMLARVVDVAREAAGEDSIDIIVATEDQRIAEHAAEIGADCVMTDDTCKTGSDRVLQAVQKLEERPDFVINQSPLLQERIVPLADSRLCDFNKCFMFLV